MRDLRDHIERLWPFFSAYEPEDLADAHREIQERMDREREEADSRELEAAA